MELPGFLKIFEGKKAEVPQQPAAEAKIVPIEQHLANHHTQIEQEVGKAVGIPQEPGSSVPTANMTPGNPLEVIQGATPANQLAARQIEIDATLPKDYENTKTGFGNAWDRNLLGKDGMTTPDEFLAKQTEREAAKKNIQVEAAEKLKEAA